MAVFVPSRETKGVETWSGRCFQPFNGLEMWA